MGRQITWKEISQSQPSFKAKPVCFRPQGRAPSLHFTMVLLLRRICSAKKKQIFHVLQLTLITFISYSLQMMDQKTILGMEISKFQIKPLCFLLKGWAA